MSEKKFEMTIRSDVNNIPLVRSRMSAVCSEIFPGEDFYEVELCISEILANVIEHTFNNIDNDMIDINIRIVDHDIYINILDDGTSLANEIAGYINSKDLPSFEIDMGDINHVSERGRGLFIVKSLMDNFTYEYVSGRNIYSMRRHVIIKS